MKYFGTDGIRKNTHAFTKKFLEKLARGIVAFFERHKLGRTILIGNDGRISSDYILTTISSVLLSHGIEVHNLGICSSPSLAYVCSRFHYPLAMMISASHNPFDYNGIKFFNSAGEKISEDDECEFEYLFDRIKNLGGHEYRKLKNVSNLIKYYISHLKELKKAEIPCIIDCAFGGASEIAKSVFSETKIINSRPNGININQMSGCTNIEILRTECIKNKTIGFALDGDGDRLLVVDESGEEISGDKLIYIFSKYFLSRGDKCVGTIYSNRGLEEKLNSRGIDFIRAQVGDKNVYTSMKKHHAILGGENSGHIIIKPYTNTGDGLLNSIILLNILSSTRRTFNELLLDYKEYYQEHASISLDEFNDKINLDKIIKKYSNEGENIIIRKSGTEPIIRIMVESEVQEKSKKTLKNIINLIKI